MPTADTQEVEEDDDLVDFEGSDDSDEFDGNSEDEGLLGKHANGATRVVVERLVLAATPLRLCGPLARTVRRARAVGYSHTEGRILALGQGTVAGSPLRA